MPCTPGSRAPPAEPSTPVTPQALLMASSNANESRLTVIYNAYELGVLAKLAPKHIFGASPGPGRGGRVAAREGDAGGAAGGGIGAARLRGAAECGLAQRAPQCARGADPGGRHAARSQAQGIGGVLCAGAAYAAYGERVCAALDISRIAASCESSECSSHCARANPSYCRSSSAR
ncbi:hypothetical protein T492DRAFT_1121291 [Pavlovales sp. CCMP2436]|nr:hypothetical protein T492DRAFT_1121291 [Pavlovales sp. CCMP2436]